MALLLGAAPAAAVDPAVDEYTLAIPDATGRHHLAPTAPQARPDQLPPGIREKLASDADGALLVEIATAKELGAPDVTETDLTSADGSGFPRATASAMGSPAALALLAAILAVTALAIVRHRGRESASRTP